VSLLDDARRLDALRVRQRRMICVACKQPFADGERGHAPDCPLLSMPKVVAALEAAERLASVTIAEGATVWCHWCGGLIEAPDSYDPPLPFSEQHAPNCPWRALVAALTGEAAVKP
jgi:hypothetical protein